VTFTVLRNRFTAAPPDSGTAVTVMPTVSLLGVIGGMSIRKYDSTPPRTVAVCGTPSTNWMYALVLKTRPKDAAESKPRMPM
jgi:hypothetical protein